MADRYTGYGMPSLDFSPLARIPAQMRAAQEFQQEQELRANRQRTLAEVANLGPDADYGAIARKVLPVDPELGMSLIKMADAQALRDYNIKRDERDFAFRQQEAEREQRNADRTANRRDAPIVGEVFDETTGQPRKVLIDPQSGTIQPIGGVKKPNEAEKALPGELASRVSMARIFLSEADELREKIAKGAVTGPVDATYTQLNAGSQGEIARKIQSGTDALLRSLTGAGMPLQEARKYVRRYEPQLLDSRKTVLSKFDQLRKELGGFVDEAYRGRGGIPGQPKPSQGRQGTQSPPDSAPSRGGPPPPRAVEFLRNNMTKPGVAEEFDEKYGIGASARVLGAMR